jgi:phosphoglycerol transferase MdoB-like AlkP superfamily enzyme
VNPFHYHGSSDADFSFLASREPSQHILNYKISSFPYNDALPHYLNEYGYKTSSFHNNNGYFFYRLSAFQKMGIQNINFVDDFEKKYGLSIIHDSLCTRIDDKEMFNILSQEVKAEKEKSFFFAITLNTHAPYEIVKEREIYPNPSGLFQPYLNSIHYVDRVLGEFYKSLPEGTLVIIYGDHTTSLETPDYKARSEDGKEYVPVFISIVGESIADKQKTDKSFALGGTLSLVDISNYLRSLIR